MFPVQVIQVIQVIRFFPLSLISIFQTGAGLFCFHIRTGLIYFKTRAGLFYFQNGAGLLPGFFPEFFQFIQVFCDHCAEVIVRQRFTVPAGRNAIFQDPVGERKNRKGIPVLILIHILCTSPLPVKRSRFFTQAPVVPIDAVDVLIHFPVAVPERKEQQENQCCPKHQKEYRKKKQDRKSKRFSPSRPFFSKSIFCCFWFYRQHPQCIFLSRYAPVSSFSPSGFGAGRFFQSIWLQGRPVLSVHQRSPMTKTTMISTGSTQVIYGRIQS